jgi:uncharacterized protein (UPF0332 family)
MGQSSSGVRILSDYEECFEKGLLRRVEPSKEKGIKSLEKAQITLGEAEKNKIAGAYTSCVMMAYLAMFHAARAILFRDGVREKSHFCVARYLEIYVEKGLLEEEYVNALDRMRDVRHIDQYDVWHYATEEEASSALSAAKGFVKRLAELLKK